MIKDKVIKVSMKQCAPGHDEQMSHGGEAREIEDERF
jgi:hypothetical protein